MIARLTAVRAARSAALWGAVFGLYILASAVGYASTYQSVAQRERLLLLFGSNGGVNAIFGPANAIDTVQGFTEWRSLGVLSLVGGVWGLLAATRLLRGEEEAGRWELLLAGRTTRAGAAVQGLLGLVAGLLTLWSVAAAVAIAAGRDAKVDFGVGRALFLATAAASSAAVFLAIGALTGQLAATRRQAAGYAGIMLGVAYGLRMIADSDTGVTWLRWATPLGWVEQMRPLTDPHPLALLPVGGCVALAGIVTVYLAATRDLGAGTMPDRAFAQPRTWLLGGANALSVRLIRPVVLGWFAALATSGLVLGLLAKSAGTAVASSSTDRHLLIRLGVREVGATAYLGLSFLVVALLVALIAVGQANAARGEEASGRLEQLLVRPFARRRWLLGRVGVAAAAVLLAGLVAGSFTWLGAATQHAGIGLLPMLAAGINITGPAIMILGVGVLAFGIRPRAMTFVCYGLLAWSFLVQLVGSVVNANRWLLDTSLFRHMAAAPAVDPNWTANAIIAAIGIGAAAIGVGAFARRDLAGE